MKATHKLIRNKRSKLSRMIDKSVDMTQKIFTYKIMKNYSVKSKCT